MNNLNSSARGEIRELTPTEMQIVAGGILPYYAAVNMWVSPLDIRALNPQPLPPRQVVAF